MVFLNTQNGRVYLTPLFKELDKNKLLEVVVGSNKDYCYITSFKDKDSDSFRMSDFYTPEFRRYRNRNEMKPESIDALCKRLAHELDSGCAIRRIDFTLNPTNLSNTIRYGVTRRKVYDNKGSFIVNDSTPQVNIDRRYFD